MLVDLTHTLEVLNEFNAKIHKITMEQAKEERDQTTILYTITVFAFVGQMLFSLMWWWSGIEEKSAAQAYGVAAFFALIMVIYRRAKGRRKDALRDEPMVPVPGVTSTPPKIPLA